MFQIRWIHKQKKKKPGRSTKCPKQLLQSHKQRKKSKKHPENKKASNTRRLFEGSSGTHKIISRNTLENDLKQSGRREQQGLNPEEIGRAHV